MAHTSSVNGHACNDRVDRLTQDDHEASAQTVQGLFEQIDVDCDGKLDKDEVAMLVRKLGMQADSASVNEIVGAMDLDGDGAVTLSEFLQWWGKAGADFKQRMILLAAQIAEQCSAEDAAALLAQRHYRGYRARREIIVSELAIGHFYNISCINLLQLANILRSPPDTRSSSAIGLVEGLISKIEESQPIEKRFFAQMEPNVRKGLLSRCCIDTRKSSQYIFEQGDQSNDTFYFVISGKVVVVIDNAKKGEMLCGATFGEKALSQDSDVGTRTAGILAVTDCIMATLTRADYYRTNGTLESNVANVLRVHPGDRTEIQVKLVKNLFSGIEFFRKIHHDSICAQLSRSCQHVRIRKNELLFRQGDDAETFYIIVRGYVRVVIDGTVVLNLGPGMTFGELGVLAETPAERRRTATIIGGKVPGAPTKQEWTSDGGNTGKSNAVMDACDLAVISRDDYLFYTQGSERSLREALMLRPDLRTDEHLKVLMKMFAEYRFFKRLSSTLMQRQVCRNLTMELCPAGHTVFREGDGGETFFLIVRGSVAGIVSTNTANRTRRFELQAGDTFGDLAVTGRTEAERKRTATMRCKEECFFAVLTRASYLKATGALEEDAYAILRKLRERRKAADLALLSSYFGELEFFKELHFPMLQTACCSAMRLQALDAEDILFEQKEWSDGVFYILLRGRLRVEIDGREVERYLETREFGTSEHALSVDPDKGDDNHRLRCDRTVIAMASTCGQRTRSRVRIDGFPRSWKPSHVFEVFKGFGKIDTVRIYSRAGENAQRNNQCDDTRWAIIQFAHQAAAERVVREKMLVHFDDETELPILEMINGARKPLSQATCLGVGLVEDDQSRGLKHVAESSLVRQADSERDVVVAALSRDDYITSCHDVLQEIIAILGMKPRSRTMKQLNLLKKFFANTDLFAEISHSNMLQRNLSRFLGMVSLDSNENLYEESTEADKIYIVIRGRIRLCSNEVPEPDPGNLLFVRTAGQTLGQEATENAPSCQYLHTASAHAPTILAFMYSADYRRICSTDGMQKTIDTFWQLGVQESAPSDPGLEPLMDFDGYKQIYLRIGKVIATKERFSLSELRSAMHEDWKNDLHEFGDPASEVLTHWQYTESLYQLIDEWCGAVESTQLYTELLQLMLEFSTDTTDCGVVLKPLQNVPCEFQRLSDMRHAASQGVVQEQRRSKIGTKSQNVKSSSFTRALLMQSTKHHSTSSPKLGDSQTPEERQEKYFRDMFNSIDVDGSGTLDRSEVAQLSISMGRELRRLELDAAMASMDPDGNGSVDFDEFKVWFQSMLDDDSLTRELFVEADKDGSGVIDREELRLMMKELGNPLSPTQLDDAMAEMDSDGSGQIDFVEFSAWWSKLSSTQKLKAQGQDPQAQYYKEMFDKADTGGEGTIDREELCVLMVQLGRPMADYELDTAMQIMDVDGSGTVDFEEFQQWFSWLTEGDMTIRKIFDLVDTDGSGLLDHEEVTAALRRLCKEKDGKELSNEQIQEAIKLMDIDGSGEVDFNEFSTWWHVYEFQQRFQPDDPVVAHHRRTFDTIAKKRAEVYEEAGREEELKELTLAIMQGRGTIDANGFLELCSLLGRDLYSHERSEIIQNAIRASGKDSEITFEIFMNCFHDLQRRDHELLTIFEVCDDQNCGRLLRNGLKRAMCKCKSSHAWRTKSAEIPSTLDSSARSAQMKATLDVEVTDEEVDLALNQLYEYQRERYISRRSMVHGPEASLIDTPLKGQVDFDTFRFWATRQHSRDPALSDMKRISKAESRKHERRKQFFRAMRGSDLQENGVLGLSVDDKTASPTLIMPTSLCQLSPAVRTFDDIGRTVIPSTQPTTSTGVPGQHIGPTRSKRYRGLRNCRRPQIESHLSHRRPLTPSGSSAAWPPMIPARMSTLGANNATARTSQDKRSNGRRPHTFDELLQLTAPDNDSGAAADEWPAFDGSSKVAPGQPLSMRGKFQPVELRPSSAEALHRFYDSDTARLSRGSSAEAVWGTGVARASQKRSTAKHAAGTKPQGLTQLAAARSQSLAHLDKGSIEVRPYSSIAVASSRSVDASDTVDASPELWYERLSSTASQLEPVPGFLDSTRGGRKYPGLGTRLNALHLTRKSVARQAPSANKIDITRHDTVACADL